VGTVDDTLTVRDFIDTVDENCSFTLQFFNYKAVVHNLLAHIDRWPKRFQRDAYDIDGPDHPGTKPTGLQQQQIFALCGHSGFPLSFLAI